MPFYRLALAILFPILPLRAADPPKLIIPAEVVPKGNIALVIPGGDCKAVTYVGQSGEDPLPSNLFADKRTFVFPTRGLAVGRYKFAAIGSLNDEHVVVEFEVVIGTPPKPPPNPNPPPPNPNPPPPDPPPEPFDSLVAALRTALAGDPGDPGEKKKWASAYAGLLLAGVDHASKVRTVGELWSDFQAAAKGPPPVIPAGSLPGVQRFCIGEVLFILGGDRNGSVDEEKVIDADMKKKLADVLSRLARALTTEPPKQ